MGCDETSADAWAWYHEEWENDSDEEEVEYLTRNAYESTEEYETDGWS